MSNQSGGTHKQLLERKLEVIEKYRYDVVGFTRDILGNTKAGADIHYIMQDKVLLPLMKGEKHDGVVAGFRACGKTAVCTIGFICHLIVYNRSIRLLLGSETAINAQYMLRNIRGHLEKNKRLKLIYGNMVGDVWRDDQFVVSGSDIKDKMKESTLRCVGIESEITSTHVDGVITDDISTDKTTRTADGREKVWQFRKNLIPIIEQGSNQGFHLDVCCWWGDDDLPDRIFRDKEKLESMAYCNIPAIDEYGTPTYPEQFPLEKLNDIREKDEKTFNIHYMNDISSTRSITFLREYIVRVPEPEYIKRMNSGIMHIKVDLGGQMKVNDPYGIVYLNAFSDRTMVIHDYIEKNLDLFEFCKFLFYEYERCKREYADVCIIVEMVGWMKTFNETLRGISRDVPEFRDKQLPPILRVDDRMNKLTRFSTITPYFATKRIKFRTVAGANLLAERLQAFGTSARRDNLRDDGVDALGFAIDHTRFPAKVYKEPSEEPLDVFLNRIVEERTSKKRDVVSMFLA